MRSIALSGLTAQRKEGRVASAKGTQVKRFMCGSPTGGALSVLNSLDMTALMWELCARQVCGGFHRILYCITFVTKYFIQSHNNLPYFQHKHKHSASISRCMIILAFSPLG